MKLLLTSAGITNASIEDALLELVGGSTVDCKIVAIPTAHNPVAGDKTWVIKEDLVGPERLKWNEFGIVDLAAVASLERELWWPQLEAADVLLFGGGNAFYLSYWMQKSGVFDVLPEWLASKVFVGISAGSQMAGVSLQATGEALARGMVLRDDEYGEVGPKGQSSAKSLKLVDFVFRPHLNSLAFPKIRKDYMAEVAKAIKRPMYAVDDQTAVQVSNGSIKVIGTGAWHFFD